MLTKDTRMIVRAWNGWTTSENAQAYEDLLNGTIAPGIIAREIPGLRELRVLRRLEGEATGHFMTLMAFDDWPAVELFAGPSATSSVVPPAAQELLCRHEAQSQHFEVVRVHRPAD